MQDPNWFPTAASAEAELLDDNLSPIYGSMRKGGVHENRPVFSFWKIGRFLLLICEWLRWTLNFTYLILSNWSRNIVANF